MNPTDFQVRLLIEAADRAAEAEQWDVFAGLQRSMRADSVWPGSESMPLVRSALRRWEQRLQERRDFMQRHMRTLLGDR